MVAVVALTGCGHKKRARITPPPPPPPAAARGSSSTKVGETETGIASWYGHPYHGRQAADGEIYDMETLVAAHRTLPFHTWVRVVNLRNGKTVEVRIIDRGPFIDGRIIDLSHAAAEKIDLVRPGIGPVRIEVISAPTASPTVTSTPRPPAPAPVRVPPLTPAAVPTPGAFAVQIGIYTDRAAADRVRDEMAASFGPTRIVRREGLHDMWRVLVGEESNESAANLLADRIRQNSREKNTFVVRLDSY